jgi:hypothetical protein
VYPCIVFEDQIQFSSVQLFLLFAFPTVWRVLIFQVCSAINQVRVCLYDVYLKCLVKHMHLCRAHFPEGLLKAAWHTCVPFKGLIHAIYVVEIQEIVQLFPIEIGVSCKSEF